MRYGRLGPEGRSFDGCCLRVSSDLAGTFCRYVLTGGTAAIVDLSTFAALHRLGIPLVVATTCSFVLGAAVNYSLCSIFVFRKPISLRGYGLFVSGALVGYCINSGITIAGASLTHFPPELCKVAGIGTAFLFNFYVNLTLIFRTRPAAVAEVQRGRQPG